MPKPPITDDYFSDEEIAEAKEKFPKSDRIHKLIARLEASEVVCRALQRYFVNQDHDDFDLSLISWRKSKGELK